MHELEAFRREKDEFFRLHPQSPLAGEQKKAFGGLKYFPENEALRLQVRVEEFNPKETVEMLTTTGDSQVYERFGRFRFQAEGEGAELTIFRGSNGTACSGASATRSTRIGS